MLLLLVSGGLSAWAPIILMILALLLFGLATFWNPNPPGPGWNKLVSAGLFFAALALLVNMLGGL